MLRDKDYELGVKIGVIDEDSSNRFPCAEEDYQYNEIHNYELEIAKLKDTIICLSKELLNKEETIKSLEITLKATIEDKNSMCSYYKEAKEDIRSLESILDKIRDN